LIALIINTHPKIDELMLSIVFSKSMLASWFASRFLATRASAQVARSAVAHQKTNTDVKTRFSSRLTQQRGGWLR
jgi:pantothenate kinase